MAIGMNDCRYRVVLLNLYTIVSYICRFCVCVCCQIHSNQTTEHSNTWCYLVVSEDASLLGVLPHASSATGRGVNSVLARVDQGEGHSVGCQADDQFVLGHSHIQPVVDGPVLHEGRRERDRRGGEIDA